MNIETEYFLISKFMYRVTVVRLLFLLNEILVQTDISTWSLARIIQLSIKNYKN